MKTNFLEQFNDQEYKVIYDKRLALITGSANAAILLKQMIYWWSKKEWQPFYKFIKPCTHKEYRKWASRCEELWLSESEYDAAIKLIGFKRGKTQNFLTQEQAPVEYYTDSNRMTYYILKPALFNNLLEVFYLVKENNYFTKKSNIPALLLYYKQLLTNNTHIEKDENNFSHTEENIWEAKKKDSKKWKPSILYEKEFGEFWALALRKEDKQRAYLNLKKILKSWTPFEIVMEWFMKYNLSRKGKDAEYTKKPANRLSGVNREDEVLPEQPPQTAKEKIEFWETKVRTLTPESPERLAFVKEHRALWWDDVRDDIRETYNASNR